MTYKDLIAVSEVPLEEYHHHDTICLRMQGYHTPTSIFPAEFNFLRDVVGKNGLKTGFELATAFGISATAAALGFKTTGGRLVSMDCYASELSVQNQKVAGAQNARPPSRRAYDVNPASLGIDTEKEALGYKCAQGLRKALELTNHLDLVIGYSPDDTVAACVSLDDPLEYVFLDANHTVESMIADTLAFWPHLRRDKFIVLFHDLWPDILPEFSKWCRDVLGEKLELVPHLRFPFGSDMGYISKGVVIPRG